MDTETKQYIDRHFERLNTKLTTLLGEKKRTTWIKASDVVKLTKWDKNKMRTARECGTIVYKKEDGHFLYSLESIPQVFINS